MRSLLAMICAATLFAAEKKPLPNQAGNDDAELAGTLLLERTEIQQALGADLGPGFIVVRIKVTPKTDTEMRVSPDDFTLLSRKDGDRSPALDPSQIAGRTALVVKPAAEQPGGDGTRTNGPIWGGVTMRKAPASTAADPPDPKVEKSEQRSPLLGALKEKILPDKETKTSVEGLLYFALNGKLMPKDVSLIYKGPAGKLVMDFK